MMWDLIKRIFINIIYLCVGILVAGVISLYVYQVQRKNEYNYFNHLVDKEEIFITNYIRWHTGILYGLEGLYRSSNSVNNNEFETFANFSLQESNTVKAIGWILPNPETGDFQFLHMKSDIFDILEGKTIPQHSPLYQMLLMLNDTSYFIDNLDRLLSTSSNNTALSSNLDMLILHPVYHKEGGLNGIAIGILDLPLLVRNAAKESRYEELVTTDTVIVPSDNRSIHLGQLTESIISIPYHVTRKVQLNNLELAWQYRPTKLFIQQNKNNNHYIVFGMICILMLLAWLLRTAQDKSKESLQRIKSAEDLNRLKTEFLANISHEIRTPLNGILGVAELIHSSKSPQQIMSYAKNIISSSELLLSIINDILDFAKIESGKMELDPMPVDMSELVEEATKIHFLVAQDKAIELAVQYRCGSEQFVYADPMRIRQILGNIVANAIKFTDKGHVIVTVQEDILAQLPDNNVQLRFSVSDTGIGLSESAKEHIFDKFTQADGSTTRCFGGTGLGLSICKNLIELMGGEIGVESEEGKGSTFWFTILCKCNPHGYQEQFEDPRLKNVRALIVDDLPVIREMISQQLAFAGMRCDVATDGAMALEMIYQAHREGNPYHIAVLDYLMPKMNGITLAEKIKNSPELQDICLIMLIASGNPLTEDDLVAKGFSSYITKPVEQKPLVQTIATIWEHYQQGETNTIIHVNEAGMPQTDSNINEPEAPGARILIVEDNVMNQIFIKEILKEMGSKYVVASNGQEAINFVEKEQFDLILMDCLMPIMDGFEATRKINQMKQEGLITERLPIIAFTANAMKGDSDLCLNAGMDDYITKPVRKMELKEMICKWFNHETTITEEITPPPHPIDAPQSDTRINQYNLINQYDIDNDNQNEADEILNEDVIMQARAILKDKYDSMVGMYIQNSQQRIDEMTAALHRKDIKPAVIAAHSLKSTSAQMGALKLSVCAKNIEVQLKEIAHSHAGQANAGEILPEIEDIYALIEETKIILTKTHTAFDQQAA